MAYVLTAVYFLIGFLVVKHAMKQRDKGNLSPWLLLVYVAIIIVTFVGGNYLNNKFLAKHDAKPLQRSLDVKVYNTKPQDQQLKSVFTTEERQQRTDALLDRKQITDHLYDE